MSESTTSRPHAVLIMTQIRLRAAAEGSNADLFTNIAFAMKKLAVPEHAREQEVLQRHGMDDRQFAALTDDFRTELRKHVSEFPARQRSTRGADYPRIIEGEAIPDLCTRAVMLDYFHEQCDAALRKSLGISAMGNRGEVAERQLLRRFTSHMEEPAARTLAMAEQLFTCDAEMDAFAGHAQDILNAYGTALSRHVAGGRNSSGRPGGPSV